MRKNVLAACLAVLMVLSLLPPAQAGAAPTDEWIPIYTLKDIQDKIGNKSGKFRLMNDIDADKEELSTKGMEVIGYGPCLTYSFGLLGADSIFDGNGHTIYNLKAPIFTNNYGTIQNLNTTVHDTPSDGKHLAGPMVNGIAIYNRGGTIDNCNVLITLQGQSSQDVLGINGVTYENTGTIRDCIVNCDIDMQVSGTVRFSGISNMTDDNGVIDHCLTAGEVRVSGNTPSNSGHSLSTALGLTRLLKSTCRCENSACALELLSLECDRELWFSPAIATNEETIPGVNNCRVASDIKLVNSVSIGEKHTYMEGYTEASRASILADWDLSDVPGEIAPDIPTPTPPTPVLPHPDTGAPADAEHSGTCGAQGDNLIWWIKDGTLTISGEGDMANYDRSDTATEIISPPWEPFSASINKVEVGSGVTSIGDYAFDASTQSGAVVNLGKYVDRVGKGSLSIYNGTVNFPGSAPSYMDPCFTNGALKLYCKGGTAWNRLVEKEYYSGNDDDGKKLISDLIWITTKTKFGTSKEGMLHIHDTFSFTNNSPYLVNSREDGYFITKSDYNKLKKGLSFSEYTAITYSVLLEDYLPAEFGVQFKSHLNIDGKEKSGKYVNWDGSCYGMSAIVAALINGSITPKDLGSSSYTSIYDLGGLNGEKKPLPNSIKSLLNFYHVQQYLKKVSDFAMKQAEGDQPAQIKNLVAAVEAAEAKNNAILVNFDMIYKGTQTGHTVAAYAVERGHFQVSPTQSSDNVHSYTGRILVYDPVNIGAEQDNLLNSIYFNDTEWAIPGWTVCSVKKGISSNSASNNASLTGFVDVNDYINAIDYRDGENNFNHVGKGRTTASGTAYIRTSNQNLTLTIGGQNVTIKNGLFDGTSTISSTGAMITVPSGGGSGSGAYTIVLPEGKEYSIRSSEDFTCSLETDNHFLTVSTLDAGTATFGASGTIDLKLDKSGSAYLGLTANDAPDWHNYELTNDDCKQVSLDLTDKGLKVTGDNLTKATVTAYDDEDAAKTLDISTKENSVLVTEENGEITLGNGGTADPDAIPFIDVKPTDYFYEPVKWAVKEQITLGTGASTFSPANPCTRGQIVTFLWRSEGSPEPGISRVPFTDVKSTDYFYKAVLWAYENEIATGTGVASFSPNAPCTRGQTVTFLWRAKGKPAYSGSKAEKFTDVQSRDYFYGPVAWAVAKNVTTGITVTTFGPNDTCARGQIVTFLYRAANQ